MSTRKNKRKLKEDERIDYTYKTLIKFQCPKRGLVFQEVEVARYKSADSVLEPLFFDETDIEHLENKDDLEEQDETSPLD